MIVNSFNPATHRDGQSFGFNKDGLIKSKKIFKVILYANETYEEHIIKLGIFNSNPIEFFKSENLSFKIYGSKKIDKSIQANRELLFSNFSDKNFKDNVIDEKTEDEILKKYTDLEIKLLSEKYLQKHYSLDIFAKEENIDRNELLIIFRRNKTFSKKQKLIRSIYENAYTKWDNEQKIKLFSLYYSGVDILDLSQTLKRSPTALIVQLFENNSLSEEEYNAHLLQLSRVNIE